MSRDDRSTPTANQATRGDGASKLSLAELTAAADVTVRTVRYYIAEGLLPPPEAGGPQSHYTRGHLDRLRLIARLKDAFLPLREIRRRLAGLDDATVRTLLETAFPESPPSPASDYLDRVLAAPRRGDRRQPAPAPGSPPRRQPPAPAPRVDRDDGEDRPPVVHVPPLDDLADEVEATAWRRVRLGEHAELLIQESSYAARQDQIEWLVRWAKRVLR